MDRRQSGPETVTAGDMRSIPNNLVAGQVTDMPQKGHARARRRRPASSNQFARAMDAAKELARCHPVDWGRVLREAERLTFDPDHIPGTVRPGMPMRWAVLERWGAACVKCGSVWKLERAHVIDVALGGGSTVDDVRPLCVYCHRMQPSFAPDEAHQALIWFYDPSTAFWARGINAPEAVEAHEAFRLYAFHRELYHDKLRLTALRLTEATTQGAGVAEVEALVGAPEPNR